jgi:hypothetical protein
MARLMQSLPGFVDFFEKLIPSLGKLLVGAPCLR